MLSTNKKKVVIGRQTQHQIVFAGSFGVGKTTALRSVSDIEVANTDVKSLELTDQLIAEGKTTTTVGFDYGELHLPDSTKIALYGLPGQDRFVEIWNQILGQDTGVILWLFGNKRDESLKECKIWLDALAERGATRKLCVVVTRLPIPTPSMLLTPYRELVSQYNPFAPVMTADPRNRDQVVQSILMAVGTPAFDNPST